MLSLVSVKVTKTKEKKRPMIGGDAFSLSITFSCFDSREKTRMVFAIGGVWGGLQL